MILLIGTPKKGPLYGGPVSVRVCEGVALRESHEPRELTPGGRKLSYLGLENYQYGCFHEFEAPFLGVLETRALLFGVCITAPDFGKLPYQVEAYLRYTVLYLYRE